MWCEAESDDLQRANRRSQLQATSRGLRSVGAPYPAGPCTPLRDIVPR
jgi:hypothetical protein